jgi:hypothetical protein
VDISVNFYVRAQRLLTECLAKHATGGEAAAARELTRIEFALPR